MRLVEAVKRTLRGSESSGDEESVFAYECTDCETEFAEPRTRMVAVACPECGSSAVHAAD